MRILLIESDPEALQRALEKQGFKVDAARTGKQADRKARAVDYGVIVLDRDLVEDGLSLLKTWRGDGIQAHVLVLTTRFTLQEKVDAFSVGADDCVMKPYQQKELIARLRALTRRRTEAQEQLITVSDLEIDTSARRVKRAGRTIALTPREYDLLQYLALHRGKPVSRSMIWNHLYDEHEVNKSNVIDVYIRYLRKKLDTGYEVPLILTCWGKGYMLRGEVEANR